ncbi:MAG TPA: hypothetical protein H9887_08840 [Candidatus Dorea intestinavium]|nr:hypothetical protein [Candidatus Dorea intestinavium]
MLKNTKGSSLISTIIAFSVLMVGLVGFTTAVFSALNVAKKGTDIVKKAENAQIEFYTGDTSKDNEIPNVGNGTYYFTEKGESKGFKMEGQKVYEHKFSEDTEYKIYYFK